jgi:hypothetical protein
MPDDTYDLSRRFSSWATSFDDGVLGATSSFDHKDDVLVELAIAQFYWSLGKEDEATKHEGRAGRLLGEALEEDMSNPDTDIVPHTLDQAARSVNTGGPYWTDPFVKSAP